MSSNLGMATGELRQMEVHGGGESLWKEAWKRLRRDKVALFGGVVVVLLVLTALLAPVISPHDPNKQYANGTSAYGMPLPIGAQGKEIELKLAQPVDRAYSVPSTVVFKSADGQHTFSTRENMNFEAGSDTVSVAVNPLNPESSKAGAQSLTPTGEDLSILTIPLASATLKSTLNFPLGTDASGRDVMSRLIYGAQVSLQVGILAIGIAVVIGAVLGLMAGYFGGWVDALIMRITDIMMAFPDLLLVMAIVAVVNPAEIGFFQLTSKMGLSPEVIFICIAISVVSWTQYARLVRSQVLTVREHEFVEASRSLGATDNHIMFKHILPNVTAPVIVVATMGIASAIMTEASLSFLGFGVKVPTSSWGSMINDSLGYFRDAPWIPLIPGLAIAVTVFAFNLFGDGVRDALDPRLK
ncbi:MAG: ABC transporter permease [Candidatus Sericytochromatia bacterium]